MFCMHVKPKAWSMSISLQIAIVCIVYMPLNIRAKNVCLLQSHTHRFILATCSKRTKSLSRGILLSVSCTTTRHPCFWKSTIRMNVLFSLWCQNRASSWCHVEWELKSRDMRSDIKVVKRRLKLCATWEKNIHLLNPSCDGDSEQHEVQGVREAPNGSLD